MKATMVLFSCLSLFALMPQGGTQAQESRPVHAQLRVAFVGTPDSARTKDFAEFLGRKFAKVDVVPRERCKPELLAAADVVVLDWPQDEGVNKWMNEKEKDKEHTCPLGPRESWTKPTVLIGSAGLNLACAWAVKGGFG